MDQNDHSLLKVGWNLIEWIMGVVRSDFKWVGRILVKGVRLALRHQPSPIERISKEQDAFPSGPYAVERSRQTGDLLLFVPRHIESFIIDDLTGRFGYSHVTVDTGEVDLPTGKAVMVEVTTGQTVQRKFQDEYPGRPYVRIPLSKTGVDGQAFVTCVLSKLGEPYGDLEALTLGEIDDPAKQVCSSVAAECLPETVQREIAKAKRLGLLHHMSVSVHSHPWAPVTDVFISPNGFAEYYGAPKGHEVRRPETLVEPHPQDTSIKGVARKHGPKALWILVAAALTASALLFITYRRKNRSPGKGAAQPGLAHQVNFHGVGRK
jgi:hypothetical protein